MVLSFGKLVVLGLVVCWSMAVTSNDVGPRASTSLKFLVVISRHGNRGPLFTFPTYTYPKNNRTFWPYGEGQLTGKGRKQMYRLGSKIRSLYNGFLNDEYYQDDFKAYSTSVDRTLMSAQAFLAGLFPPKDFQVWNDELLWQPIPVFPTVLDHTQLLAGDPSKLCPKFAVAQEQSLDHFYEEEGVNITRFLFYLFPYTGIDPAGSTGSAFNLRRLWDALICAVTEELPIPDWAANIFPEPVENYVAKMEVASTIGSDEMVRLLQGQLFQEMASLMKAKADGSLSPNRKMVLYSGHDMTVRGLQGILGIKRLNIVRPGSALLFELHQDENDKSYYFQALYIDGNSADLEPSALTIPDCGVTCPLDDLINMTRKYHNITDYQAECQA